MIGEGASGKVSTDVSPVVGESVPNDRLLSQLNGTQSVASTITRWCIWTSIAMINIRQAVVSTSFQCCGAVAEPKLVPVSLRQVSDIPSLAYLACLHIRSSSMHSFSPRICLQFRLAILLVSPRTTR